jgi:hypothetical protein
MTAENLARLKITSLVRTPETISEFVGITCDRSWRVGDRRARSSIEEKNHGWILNSSLENTAPLEAHIQKLIERVSGSKEKIHQISQEDNVEFSCVVYASRPPALNFDARFVTRLAELGASLDIDLCII